jgi:hypothetical protein
MFTTKNVGKLRKNVEKNVGITSEKYSRKSVGKLPKNVDEF